MYLVRLIELRRMIPEDLKGAVVTIGTREPRILPYAGLGSVKPAKTIDVELPPASEASAQTGKGKADENVDRQARRIQATLVETWFSIATCRGERRTRPCRSHHAARYTKTRIQRRRRNGQTGQ